MRLVVKKNESLVVAIYLDTFITSKEHQEGTTLAVDKREDFVIKYSECPVGWKRNLFMVKKSNFLTEMCWKQSACKDNHPGENYKEKEI